MLSGKPQQERYEGLGGEGSEARGAGADQRIEEPQQARQPGVG